jgi:hypothetical protein
MIISVIVIIAMLVMIDLVVFTSEIVVVVAVVGLRSDKIDADRSASMYGLGRTRRRH